MTVAAGRGSLKGAPEDSGDTLSDDGITFLLNVTSSCQR